MLIWPQYWENLKNQHEINVLNHCQKENQFLVLVVVAQYQVVGIGSQGHPEAEEEDTGKDGMKMGVKECTTLHITANMGATLSTNKRLMDTTLEDIALQDEVAQAVEE